MAITINNHLTKLKKTFDIQKQRYIQCHRHQVIGYQVTLTFNMVQQKGN